MFKLRSKKVLNLILFIGFLLSIMSGWYIYQYYDQEKKLNAELKSHEVLILIKNRMAAYEQVLKSGIGLFKASPNISRKQWAIFVNEHKLDENFKGIQGFGYSEVVLPENKTKHEERIKKEGFNNFKIHPAGQRELYTSIVYLEPFDERNTRAFGYDMFSEKVRNKAMSKAITSGNATLSGKITLVQEFDTDIQAGFLMYLPLYKKNTKLDTQEERMSAIKGFVYAPFRADDLMHGILGSELHSIDFTIYDGSIVTNENVLYNSGTKNKSKTLFKKVELPINGHTWTIVFTIKESLKDSSIFIIMIIPFFILMLTYLLYILIKSFIRTQEDAQSIAEVLTKDLKLSQERLQFSLEGSGDGLWDWNLKTNEVFFSKSWKEMLGFEEDEIDSSLDEWKKRVHPKDLEQVYADLIAHTEGKSDNYKNEHRVICKDGSYKWILDRGMVVSYDTDGTPLRMVGSHSDISERKESQLRIEALSITDTLTQLYNRLKLDEIFSMKLATARRYNTAFSVIIIDIDYFKNVNDTWGHQAGDDVLKEFANILKNNVRETDVIGRWGGEEFLILSSDTDLNGAVELSEKLREIISLFKFSFAEHKTASFGVSSHHVGDDEKTMVKRADEALYSAKEKGRNRVEVKE